MKPIGERVATFLRIGFIEYTVGLVCVSVEGETVGRIARLEEGIANRIAAGEVVERPASVVKELVENAIDAKASHIEVSVAQGGTELIRVMDDGEGMDPEDALLCLERHATSKLSAANDLDSIQTLGFRGEAIPAMASVSRLALRTRCEGQEAATEVLVEGGRLNGSTSVGGPLGTTVEVRDLFYNAPARRKFMKSHAAESREIGRIASDFALAHSSLAFSLEIDGREKFRFGLGLPFEERIRHLYGKEVTRSLKAVRDQDGPLEIHGWVAGPEHARGRSYGGLLVLNGRPIRDRALSKAVMDGYGALLPSKKFPLYVIHIIVPSERVDVNVHPAKLEVRFRDATSLYRILSRAVRAAWQGEGQRGRAFFQGVDTEVRTRGEPMALQEGFLLREPAADLDAASPWSEKQEAEAVLAVRRDAAWKVRGQVGKTYIICEDEEGLVLVDQHAAHERILYDQLLRSVQDKGPPTQDLLIPQVLKVSLGDEEVEGPLKEQLGRLGFEVEPFGPGELCIRSVPALVGESLAPDAMLEILDAYRESGSLPREERISELAKVVSCRAAVKAGEVLSKEEMEGLLEGLEGLQEGTRCPHGRPIAVRMSFRDLEKLFGRR